MMTLSSTLRPALAAALALAATAALADEAAIRKALTERMPNLPKIDDISKTPVAGLYEIRIGNDIIYSDENGNHLIEGSLFDTRSKIDLTKARIDKFTAVNFADLPFKDAVVFKQGNGSRKVALFTDPNCGYCKRIEKDLQNVKDVTIYAFIIPILGPDSTAKAKDAWCAKDTTKAWRAWMIDGQALPRSAASNCDTSAIDRNLAFARKYRIQSTPALIFEDGSRVPGAIPLQQVEKQLADAAKKS